MAILNETLKQCHLQIIIGKTNTMIVNSYQHHFPYPDTVCKLNEKPIENVKKFRYLGDDFQYDQPNTGDAEVALHVAVADSKFL